MTKKWRAPKVRKVNTEEDSTSMDCQGKRIGCYAGSSCGSVKNNQKSKLKK